MRTWQTAELDNTPISGTIPLGIGRLVQLTHLEFDRTRMSGTLPVQAALVE